MFLMLVSFLAAPAFAAAVHPPLKVALIEPESPRNSPFLFPRHHELDESCSISGWNQCHDMGADYCCRAETRCMILAARTTVLCCPEGSTCAAIEPIPCNVSLQDPSKWPKAPIKTTVFDEEMETCGERCCPYGYRCNRLEQCVLAKDQDDWVFSGSKSSSTASAASTTTETGSSSTSAVLPVETSEEPDLIVTVTPPLATATASESASLDEDDSSEKDNDNSAPTGAVVGGTVAGACCLVGIFIFIWMKWFWRRRPLDTPDMKEAQWPWEHIHSPEGTPDTTRHLYLTRGPDDKFIVTPSTAGFSPLQPPQPLTAAQRWEQDPVELPATPVSLCMWMGLENAAVEEPKLAYVVPARQSR
ncbi:hypothetical protein ACJ41O_013365 [Fusarium nematophilum]